MADLMLSIRRVDLARAEMYLWQVMRKIGGKKEKESSWRKEKKNKKQRKKKKRKKDNF